MLFFRHLCSCGLTGLTLHKTAGFWWPGPELPHLLGPGHGESALGRPEDFCPEQLAADVRAALKVGNCTENNDPKNNLESYKN